MAFTINLFSILRAVLTLGVGFVLAKVSSEILEDLLKGERMQRVLRPRGYGELEVELVTSMVKYFIYVLVFLVVIMQFGVGEFIIQTISIIFILVLFLIMAYSLKEFIPNVAAGLYINRNDLFEAGEVLQIGEFKGEVIKKGVLSTIIQTADNKVVMIPNSIVARRKIIKIPEEKLKGGE